MGISKDEALKNRGKVLNAANKLFRDRGADSVGVTELMKTAGFTQGGFYNHFGSKEELVGEVVAGAMSAGFEDLQQQLASKSGLTGQVEHYLSTAHRDDIENGCPVAGLAHDVRRMGDGAQLKFARGLRMALEELGNHIGEGADRAAAAALYSQLVGGLILARATANSDPELSKLIAAAAKKSAMSIVSYSGTSEQRAET